MIVDEADFFLFQDPALFKARFQNNVICFTATLAEENSESIELQVL